MRLFLLLLFLPFCVVSLSAKNDPEVEVILYEEEPSDDIIDPEGQRDLTVSFICTINRQSGVGLGNFNGIINEYNIEDAVTSCPIASFSEESDFIDFIFSYTGEVRIRLLTDFYPLVGYLTLNNQY